MREKPLHTATHPRDRVSEIEDAIAAGKMDAPMVFTKMKELLSQSAVPAAPKNPVGENDVDARSSGARPNPVVPTSRDSLPGNSRDGGERPATQSPLTGSDALKAAEETISKSMSWLGAYIPKDSAQAERLKGMQDECRETLALLRSRPSAIGITFTQEELDSLRDATYGWTYAPAGLRQKVYELAVLLSTDRTQS